MNEREKNVIVDCVVSCCSPLKIILYGLKHGISSGKLKTASICIICNTQDKNALIKELYLKMPLEIQVNIKLYTNDEWLDLLLDLNSYASWIFKKGTVLYESDAQGK